MISRKTAILGCVFFIVATIVLVGMGMYHEISKGSMAQKELQGLTKYVELPAGCTVSHAQGSVTYGSVTVTIKDACDPPAAIMVGSRVFKRKVTDPLRHEVIYYYPTKA